MIDAVLQRETERTVKIGLIGLPKQRVGSSILLSRSKLPPNWRSPCRNAGAFRVIDQDVPPIAPNKCPV